MSPKNDLNTWFEAKQDESTMAVSQIPLEEVGDPWGMNSGNFQRTDDRFHRLTGAEISTGEREVSTWKQPLLEELGEDGIVAIVQEQITKQVLITAKAEPGNDTKGHVLLAPSFQASSANIDQVHGGEKPPLVQLLEMDKTSVDQPQDGGRYLGKKVNVRVIQIESKDAIADLLTENHRWTDVQEVEEAILQGLCNPYLRDTYLLLLLKDK